MRTRRGDARSKNGSTIYRRITLREFCRAIGRIEGGHTSGLKSVGEGIHEWRIDWGPGLRLYMAFEGRRAVLLLGGGTKRRQQADIRAAQARWADYGKRSNVRKK